MKFARITQRHSTVSPEKVAEAQAGTVAFWAKYAKAGKAQGRIYAAR